jgi:hypothetical protein
MKRKKFGGDNNEEYNYYEVDEDNVSMNTANVKRND